MKPNMGNTDKAIRILLAIVIVVLYFTKQISGTAALILLLLGGILIASSLISYCPIYQVFGWSTKPKEKK